MHASIKAILANEVVDFLNSLGLGDRLRNGELVCTKCGSTITAETFLAVTRHEGELLLICNSTERHNENAQEPSSND